MKVLLIHTFLQVSEAPLKHLWSTDEAPASVVLQNEAPLKHPLHQCFRMKVLLKIHKLLKRHWSTCEALMKHPLQMCFKMKRLWSTRFSGASKLKRLWSTRFSGASEVKRLWSTCERVMKRPLQLKQALRHCKGTVRLILTLYKSRVSLLLANSQSGFRAKQNIYLFRVTPCLKIWSGRAALFFIAKIILVLLNA